MNALVVTSHTLAMVLEDSQLLLHRARISAYVAGVGLLCHQFERPLLATTPDQQRDMGLLDPLGLIDGPPHLIRGALEMRLPLLPHRQNEAYRLAQLAQPL